MIQTLKNTTKEIYKYLKDKVVRFKKWLVILICGAAVVAAPIVLPNVPDVALEKIQQKYNASELKDKYRLEKTAFILDAVDENAIQAEVGNKNSDSFEPSLTLRKWNDEVNFKVKYKHAEKEKDQKVDIENKKIKWKGKKVEVHYYDIKKGELLHNKVLEADSFEVEVLLLEKPDTNIVSFDIETKGLSFYYQPELTQKEKDEGAFRPENVVGSYAVYHESKQGDYSKMGLKNYRAGKAFHIYRPKIIDNAGKEVWGELNIENNLLTVEIPQEFLDNAVYPVRHAAGLTFGYEVKGGTETNGGNNRIYGTKFTNTAGVGTGNSITMYIKYAAAHPIKFALYDHNATDNEPENRLAITDEWTITSGYDAEKTLNFTTSPSISNSTIYWLTRWSGPAGSMVVSYAFYYDSGDVEQSCKLDLSYGTYPNPFGTVSGYYNDKHTIYCTYTAGGAERRMFLTQ